MEMPEGWKRLCWFRDNYYDRDLPFSAMRLNEAAALLKEMAEALEAQYLAGKEINEPYSAHEKIAAALKKFKDWK